MKIHSESLLNVPLVRAAIVDRNLKFQARGVDAEWYYRKAIPIPMGGFNPFLSTFFYPKNSIISRWFGKTNESPRLLNESDLLVREVFFLVHDFFHQWAYRCINALLPKHRFGEMPVTHRNFEDYVFFHLVTEAVATVGLDYWYLSTVHLNSICDLGSGFSSLTVSYREEYEMEYRRFNPSFTAQKPDFFGQITRFYCDGVFQGFHLEDIRRSPRLLSWLRHELRYGEIQREYARSWFSFLCVDELSLSPEDLQAPVDVSSHWKKRLIYDIGLLLWEKVKYGKESPIFPRFDSQLIWRSAEKKEPDFRFLNLKSRDPAECARKILSGRYPGRNFRHFFYQYVSSFDYESFDKELIKLFPVLINTKDFQLVEQLFKNQKRLSPVRGEPEHLFILN